ncbi:MAG: hypothetical protein HQL34_13050 [Alphaproteobacteria bacterium]|nr:hypothetical protein [Alphaproteobacteria bacterium]
MSDVKKIIVDDRGGDGPVLRSLPRKVAIHLRRLALSMREQRQKRLIRVVRRIYPALQALEQEQNPDGPHVLADLSFDEAFENDLAIEHGLILFRDAWDNEIVEFRRGPRRVAIPPGQDRKTLPCCGMSVTAAERFFLYRAARLIFKEQTKIRFNAKDVVTEPASLPRLRTLASVEPRAIVALQHGLGARFKELLYPENHDHLVAISKLPAAHIEALNEALGPRATDLAGWEPEFVTAIAESLTCPEQIRDIGQHILVLKGPAAIRAIGKWPIRDVTDKVNEEVTRRGGPKIAGKAYETDIGTVRNLLGGDFTLLLEQPAELLRSVLGFVTQLRSIEKKTERADRVEEFKLFSKRYLPYMTPEVLGALRLLDANEGKDPATSISFREALGILEGLWSKEGLGRSFFEDVLPTPNGVQAMKSLVDDLLVMKQRGSIKANTDIAAILSGSDLFDSHISQFLNRKAGIM